jgi:large subunit ribosomal protein L6
MSRIGRKPITVPAGVDVKIDGSTVTVKGKNGTLSGTYNPAITVSREGDELIVTRPNDAKENRSLHGLTRTLISNMVTGVSEGFRRELEIQGVGYRAAKQGKSLVMNLGYSHQITMEENADISIEVPAPNRIIISGPDKQKVGQFAAEVRGMRPPEPYKGKGIRYLGEYVIRKEGKAGKGKK